MQGVARKGSIRRQPGRVQPCLGLRCPTFAGAAIEIQHIPLHVCRVVMAVSAARPCLRRTLPGSPSQSSMASSSHSRATNSAYTEKKKQIIEIHKQWGVFLSGVQPSFFASFARLHGRCTRMGRTCERADETTKHTHARLLCHRAVYGPARSRPSCGGASLAARP